MKTLLKKTALILSGIAFISTAHAQTTIRVAVSNDIFTPKSFSAFVGDTVKFVWKAGTHTTSSTSVPAGAATWGNLNNSVPIDMGPPSSDTSFKYAIKTSGVYEYQCDYHVSFGMVGTFTATVATGISTIAAQTKQTAQVYPNPANNVVNIHLSVIPTNNVLTITDILGKEVITQTLTKTDNAMDVSTWKKGVYFYHLKNNGGEMEEGKFEVQ